MSETAVQKGRRRARSPFRSASNTASSWIICTLLVILVWIVFGQTLQHDFVNYDDDQYVYDNATIRSGLALDGVRWAITHVHAGNWHPLTSISHMLDCQIYGLQPWGHHLTNIILHAAVVILLFFALLALTESAT